MPAPLPIVTERLVIRLVDTGDLDAMVDYRSDPETAALQGWTPEWSIDDARRLVEPPGTALPERPGDSVQLAIEGPRRSLCGDIWVRLEHDQPGTYELGVTVAASARGVGIAGEGLGAVADALFVAGAHRVFTQSDARNHALHRVVERLGFRREAELVDADWFKEEWTTLVIHACLDTEWAGPRPERDGTGAVRRVGGHDGDG